MLLEQILHHLDNIFLKKYYFISLSNLNTYTNIFYYFLLPYGTIRGYARVNALLTVLESDVVPSHTIKTYVNFKSNERATNIFCVG